MKDWTVNCRGQDEGEAELEKGRPAAWCGDELMKENGKPEDRGRSD